MENEICDTTTTTKESAMQTIKTPLHDVCRSSHTMQLIATYVETCNKVAVSTYQYVETILLVEYKEATEAGGEGPPNLSEVTKEFVFMAIRVLKEGIVGKGFKPVNRGKNQAQRQARKTFFEGVFVKYYKPTMAEPIQIEDFSGIDPRKLLPCMKTTLQCVTLLMWTSS